VYIFVCFGILTAKQIIFTSNQQQQKTRVQNKDNLLIVYIILFL